jgi:hypothetical protein
MTTPSPLPSFSCPPAGAPMVEAGVVPDNSQVVQPRKVVRARTAPTSAEIEPHYAMQMSEVFTNQLVEWDK